MSDQSDNELLSLVRKAMDDANLNSKLVSIRRFPGETIVIIEVSAEEYERAVSVGNELDHKIEDGFVTVKKSKSVHSKPEAEAVKSLLDPRVNDLIEVLNARSRTSELQPSLHYIQDAAHTLNVATSRRHHLIFGRRGVGKTALMLEAKRKVEERGAAAFWINIQTMRNMDAFDAFLTTAMRICELPAIIHSSRGKKPLSIERGAEIKSALSRIRGLNDVQKEKSVARAIPDIQQLLLLLGKELQDDIYIFLDDIHYLAMKQQPVFLDLLHSVTRDTTAWLKAAGIKHQSRWFTDNPPIGLQTGHDAAIVNLDVTLEQPAKAKEFLLHILKTYLDQSNLGGMSSVFSGEAIDRLVLASGGVPRDFLVLSATAIQVARERANARATGVQDVNEAAGRIAQVKLQELEDDAASSIGRAESRTQLLNALRKFLLEDKQITYFGVSFQAKELLPAQYELLQSLMDLRLIHLINASLSDERRAGQRSEVYMLDLSQFSGSRLKKNLKVLDFTKSYLVVKQTGVATAPKPGDTAKKLQGILRRGPQIDLAALSSQIDLLPA